MEQQLYEELGRSYTLSRDGESDNVVRRWKLARRDTETVPKPADLGLPALGTPFSSNPDLVLSRYSISEDESNGAVVYEAQYERPPENEETTGEGEDQETIRVESRGWRGTSFETPAVYDVVTGEAVVLPTGEPFENVPNAARAGATFHITYLSKKKSGAMGANCTVNAGAITIDGVDIPARCGRLSVSEDEITDKSSDWNYRVSLEVDVRHNIVKLSPGGNDVDIGHDTALLLQGYKYRGKVVDRYGNERDALVPFMESDGKGGSKPATTPGFLKEDGTKLDDPSPTNCYFVRVHTIEESSWNASWFK